MPDVIGLLRKFVYNLRRLFSSAEPEVFYTGPLETQPDPRLGVIAAEPLVAFKDGFLVVAVEHVFGNVPSWVEWDAERCVLSFTQMNGDMDEASVFLAPAHLELLQVAQKLLLVSLEGENSVVHFLPFLARV